MNTTVAGLVGVMALALGACSVRLPISDATAEPLRDLEAEHLKAADPRVSVPGSLFLIRVSLPRASAETIARRELHTSIRVENCSSGSLVAVVGNGEIAGMGGEFHRLRKLLETNPRQPAFTLAGSAFFGHGEAVPGLCASLSGGSYSHKIKPEKVPLKFRTT